MNQHLKMAAIAVAVSGSFLAADRVLSPPQKPVVISTTGKQMPHAWGDLSQAEIDALTAILAKMPKREIVIFCASKDCDDIAIDFDNAFESAHWVSGIERPLSDTNIGFNVGPKDDADAMMLAAAIESATNGRIKPGFVEVHLVGNRMAVVISRRQ